MRHKRFAVGMTAGEGGERRQRISEAEATLSSYSSFTRQTLAPLMLYKSLFLSDWFKQVVQHASDDSMGRALTRMSAETLREMIEVLVAMRDWDAGQADAETAHLFVQDLNMRLLQDLLHLKEGSNELVMLAAMRAPTDDVRNRLMRLADLDRVHADQIRVLLGARTVMTSLDRVAAPSARRETTTLGAHSSRAQGSTLGESIEQHVEVMREQGDSPERLILSHVALRHLRDEKHVQPDGTAFGLPIDIDFGWEGECYTILTSSRVRLAELLTLNKSPKGEDLLP